MEDGQHQGDENICRVCRSEGSSDRPLFHPCICTGSIKFIHQECLLQWLKYSKKEHCELCKHRFSFTPIYSPDMPTRLPIMDIVMGLVKSIGRAIRYWFHYTLVAVAWLGVVPLTACRIYRCLFAGSVSSLLTLPLDMLSTENLLTDCFQGCFVVMCTLCAFISLVWLREQILHGGGPDWLEIENPFGNNMRQNVNNGAAAPAPPGGAAGNIPGNQGNQPAANQEAANQGGAEGMAAEEVEAEDEAVNGANNAAQEENWNPIEWDRAAEELTWERLLGLDGSLVFLEHVFWVVSLNTLFILVFAFCPYHIGHFTIIGLKAEAMVSVLEADFPHTELLSASQFEGLLTTLLGYLLISVSLVILHTMVSVASFKRSKRILGLCYVVVKVSLLVVVEIGVFPLVCGWWLDICSLSMFDASLKDRESSFKLAPGTSMFIHWLVGMVYVFYFASFILLLREVVRPGVLWFLRNLNDPDFNPIQEMIHLPIYRHVRRFLASMVIFGSTVLIMLWLPVRVIRALLPDFLPYNVMLSSDSPVSELSLELLLLQVVLPALLEQGHTRQWLKNLVRGWCVAMAWVLHLRSYLLGDVPLEEDEPAHDADAPGDMSDDEEPEEVDPAPEAPRDPPVVVEEEPPPLLEPHHVPPPPEGAEPFEPVPAPEEPAPAQDAAAPPPVPPPHAPPAQGLGAAHQAMLQGGGPAGFQPYKRPNVFHFRLLCLCVIMCITLFFASLFSFIVPVYLGRKLMSLWMGEARIHELYTAACGLYTCWVVLRAITVLYNWVPQGFMAIFSRVREWFVLAMKTIIIASMLIGVVPLLLGLLFELVVVAPLRVPLDQSPVFFPWQDWALGVLHAKIICAVTMMGPNWWLRRVIEQVYNQGLRNLDLLFVLTQLCLPVIGVLGMILAVPYILARSAVPALGCEFEMQNLVLRRIYPFLFTMTLLCAFCILQAQQFKRLYEHIKNDKYLVGQRLVNYDRQRGRSLS